ncbi:sulfur relay protein TusB/DsrH [Marinospirillum celere]|uniref:Sulfur relay protein TusB/DsrH n=1 Tax=Marinospirillum celere TaxID=1122252 RepID=A0A1I1G165_9GAMM|nr:DsrH/TusB family sulfur metabolism protein [Marinospirillum celere]SFC05354.1 sulfur relay protein TusB/DsrH [Marinospirillum celere]
MATLHQLNAANKLESCRPFLEAGDQLLLIEAAVFLALDEQALQTLPPGVELLVLQQDLDARGLSTLANWPLTRVTAVQWVERALEAERVCSW